MFSATINITNTIIGGGLLEMPYVMMTFGVYFTFFILFMIYLLTMVSLKMLLKVKLLTFLEDYYKVSKQLFSDFGGWVVKVCLLMNNIGVSTAYLIIFLDSSERLLKDGL